MSGSNYNDLLGYSSGSGKSYKAMAPRCFESHPPMPIGEFFVYGGSCSVPKVKDADVYIGFDYSMSFSTGHWPWDKKTDEVYFHVTDMQAPDSPGDFKKLVAWTAAQITAGRKVHAGCIGGHGRTGTFLAALVTFMTGELDSITYVRKHYCKKAVESQVQITFLNQHFGITKIEASKTSFSWENGSKQVAKGKTSSSSGSKPFSSKPVAGREIVPVSSRLNIWKTT